MTLEGGPDIAHPQTFADAVPYAQFDRLRAGGEVVWVDEPLLVRHSQRGQTADRGSGYWAVLSHRAVVEASRTPTVFSSEAKGAFLPDPRTRADLRAARQLLINMDDPRHARVRRLVGSSLTPRAVARLQQSIFGYAADLAAEVNGRDSFDGVREFAVELPLLVLADLLGVPATDRELMFGWSNVLVGFDDPEYGGGNIEAYRAVFAEAARYVFGLAARRRDQPTPDLTSILANAEIDGERLSDAELVNFWLLLVVGGNETTRHLLSGSLLAFAEHPDRAAELAADPELLEPAIEELLRWVSPTMQFRRTATVDTELAGQPIAAGDKVVLYYIAANRDPAVYDDPHTLRFDRPSNPHLGFGIGPHFCLGANLARLELRALLTALGPELASLRLAGPPVRLASNFVNGLKSLPLGLKKGT